MTRSRENSISESQPQQEPPNNEDITEEPENLQDNHREPEEPPRSSQKSKSPRNHSSDSQRQRISLPEAVYESNDKSRSTARKSTGSRSTYIDINTIKELQKDQEVSKFNYETLKRTLNDVKNDFRGEFHDVSEKVSGLLDDRSERENEMQKWKYAFSHMIDEKLKPISDQMETLRQTLEKVQSSSQQSEKTQSVTANIPLLSRTITNQPTPRNKTIERVQTQTQREELSNPSPAPRMLGKHSRPRDSTDSDIVETILMDDDNQESRYDEDEEQPPPKKRFKAGTNIWGGALALEPTKSMPDVSNTTTIPTFGPQFNNVAIVNTSNDESLGNGEKDKSVPPPTPPATKTRYGTERDYDNRFAD